MDNESGGVNLDQSGVQLSLLHPTLARNNIYGLRATNGATANLANAILARNALALYAESGAAVSVNGALWDANTVDTSGTVVILNRFDGAAAFDPADGYHLTQYSKASGKGQSVGLTADIDGTARPQPAGSAPDLGADEFNQAAALTLSAEKLALPPVWINTPDASSNPLGSLLQQYWIRLHYGSPDEQATAIDVCVQDTLPAEVQYQSEQHSPQMTFEQNGQGLTWQTVQPLAVYGTVDIQIDARAQQSAARQPAHQPGSGHRWERDIQSGGLDQRACLHPAGHLAAERRAVRAGEPLAQRGRLGPARRHGRNLRRGYLERAIGHRRSGVIQGILQRFPGRVGGGGLARPSLCERDLQWLCPGQPGPAAELLGPPALVVGRRSGRRPHGRQALGVSIPRPGRCG